VKEEVSIPFVNGWEKFHQGYCALAMFQKTSLTGQLKKKAESRAFQAEDTEG
jgi:hypothetical protein